MDDTTPGGGGGPAGVPGMSPGSPGGGPVAERMQALLSRAVDEQVSEQRQTSAVLGDLRIQIAAVADQLRGLASGDRVEQLASDLGSLTTELRRSTTGVGERLDALARRVDEQASAAAETSAAGSAGTEALAVRLGSLGADVAAQGAALDRVGAALGALSSFPDALGALQSEIAGLHDRLTALSDLRNGLADLTGRTATLEGLRPELAAVAERVQVLATSGEVTGARDSTVTALADRLDRIEVAGQRPTLTADDLDAALVDIRERVQEAASGGAALARLEGVEQRFTALEERLAELGSGLTEVRQAAGGVPGVASDVAALSGRLDALGPLQDDVASVRTALTGLQEDSGNPALVVGLTSLREDVEDVGSRLDALSVPSADAVALAVSNQVGDRIVDALAPRVADVVLNRVAGVLVEQVADTVTASVQNGLTERVRAATAESERRMSAHVDEAILALAEALLRRRRSGRGGTVVAAPAALTAEPATAGELPAPVPMPGLDTAAAPGAEQDVATGPPAAEPVEAPPAETPADALAEPVDVPVDEPFDEPFAEPGLAQDAGQPEAPDDEPVVPGVAEVADEPVEGALDPTQEQAEAELAGREELSGAGDDVTDRTDDQPPADTPDLDGGAADDDEAAGALAAQAATDPAEPLGAEELVDLPVVEEPQDAEAPAEDDDEPAPVEAAASAGDPEVDDEGESASERTGAFALRSGLRGLGLEVEDPVLDDDEEVPVRTAARTAPPARPRLLDPTPDLDDDGREAGPPVRPRADVQERFASASTSAPAALDASPADDDDEDDDGPRRRPWWRPGG